VTALLGHIDLLPAQLLFAVFDAALLHEFSCDGYCKTMSKIIPEDHPIIPA